MEDRCGVGSLDALVEPFEVGWIAVVEWNRDHLWHLIRVLRFHLLDQLAHQTEDWKFSRHPELRAIKEISHRVRVFTVRRDSD